MGRKILVRAPSPGRRFYRTYYEGTDPRAAVVDEFRLHLKPGELNDKMLLALHIGASVMLGRVPSPEMYAQAKAFAERASHQAEGVKRILDGLRHAAQRSAADSFVESMPEPKGPQELPVAESQRVEPSAVHLPPPLPAHLSPRMSAPIAPPVLQTSMEHQPPLPQKASVVPDLSAEAGVPASASGGTLAGAAAGGSRAAAHAAFAAFGD